MKFDPHCADTLLCPVFNLRLTANVSRGSLLRGTSLLAWRAVGRTVVEAYE
jgi:hypothetical protein